MSYQFNIGQEVVCIKTHSQGAVKEGNIYTIHRMKKPCCTTVVDVGVKSSHPIAACTECKGRRVMNDNIWWIASDLFAPLGDISELEAILNTEKVKI